MRLYLSLLFSVVIARIVSLAMDFVFPGVSMINYVGNSINFLSNLIFVISLATIIMANRNISLTNITNILVIPGFIITVIVIAFSGFVVGEASYEVGLLMISLIGAIGYYPSGADVPFGYGAAAWALSVLVPIVASMLLGTVLRRFSRGLPQVDKDNPPSMEKGSSPD